MYLCFFLFKTKKSKKSRVLILRVTSINGYKALWKNVSIISHSSGVRTFFGTGKVLGYLESNRLVNGERRSHVDCAASFCRLQRDLHLTLYINCESRQYYLIRLICNSAVYKCCIKFNFSFLNLSPVCRKIALESGGPIVCFSRLFLVTTWGIWRFWMVFGSMVLLLGLWSISILVTSTVLTGF